MVVEVAAVTGEWLSGVGAAHELANATSSPSSSAAAARCVVIVVLRASWTRGGGGAVVEEVSFILGFKAFWAGPNYFYFVGPL
jgi:hypothetical protein